MPTQTQTQVQVQRPAPEALPMSVSYLSRPSPVHTFVLPVRPVLQPPGQ